MRLLKRATAGVVLGAMLLYMGDYVVARRLGARVMGTVQVQPYYAVPLRNGKTEFIMLDPETRACLHAVFPHFGCLPCWYLNGRKQQRINM